MSWTPPHPIATLDRISRQCDAQRQRADSLEDQLATLRSEVSAVQKHLETYAEGIEMFGAENLAKALREDVSRLEKLGGQEK